MDALTAPITLVGRASHAIIGAMGAGGSEAIICGFVADVIAFHPIGAGISRVSTNSVYASIGSIAEEVIVTACAIRFCIRASALTTGTNAIAAGARAWVTDACIVTSISRASNRTGLVIALLKHSPCGEGSILPSETFAIQGN